MRQLTGQTKCVSALAGAAAILLAVSGTHGQTCTPEFSAGFEMAGVNGPIFTSVMYDAQDGNGPRLYVGGQFSRAGGKLCNGIAMWNGTNFEPLGGGLPSNSLATSGSGIVYDLEVFDPDGDGPMTPELWAGGSFARARQTSGALVTVNGVARWNGATQTWASVPLSGGTIQVVDLLVDNHVSPVPGENDGPRIYLANTLTTGSSRYITAYRWNGGSYSQIFIGEADNQPILDSVVWCLAKYNGRVYFGGAFTHGVGRITEDGLAHERLPADPAMALSNVNLDHSSPTASMVAYNGRLLIGPQLSAPAGSGTGQVPMESFNGTSWQPETFGPLGTTTFTPVGELTVIDSKLYMGDLSKNGAGFARPTGSPSDLPPEFTGGAVWDGTSLQPFADGVLGSLGDVGMVYTFTKTTIRNQPAIFMGGLVIGGRNADASLVRGQGGIFWGGTEWIPQYATPAKGGFSGGSVIRLDGVNDVIVSNGDAGVIQDITNNPKIVQYNGEEWANSNIPVPTLVSSPRYIRYDDGTGEALFAYGQSPNHDPAQFSVQKWNAGSQEWVSVSSGASLPGSTGQGLPAGFTRAATLFDPDGAGPERTWLVIAGTTGADNNFTSPPAIVAYTGTQWVVLGSGLPDGPGLTDDSNVTSLAVFDDGSGPKLFASGSIFESGAGTVARYDGTGASGTWTVIGQSGGGKLRVLDLGSGPQLYLYGGFSDAYVTSPNAVPTGPIARWTGTDWVDGAGAAPLAKTAPQSPFTALINDLCVFDDGSGPAMYAVGPFGSIGGTPAQGIAKYDGTAWSALGLGFNSYSDNLRLNPSSMVVYDDDGAGGVPPALYIAGALDNAGGTYSERFARFGCTVTFCAGDFNASGTTTADDIFAFLDAWFAQNGSVGPGFSADVDGNESVTADDIFSFLDSWFLCNS